MGVNLAQSFGFEREGTFPSPLAGANHLRPHQQQQPPQQPQHPPPQQPQQQHRERADAVSPAAPRGDPPRIRVVVRKRPLNKKVRLARNRGRARTLPREPSYALISSSVHCSYRSRVGRAANPAAQTMSKVQAMRSHASAVHPARACEMAGVVQVLHLVWTARLYGRISCGVRGCRVPVAIRASPTGGARSKQVTARVQLSLARLLATAVFLYGSRAVATPVVFHIFFCAPDRWFAGATASRGRHRDYGLQHGPPLRARAQVRFLASLTRLRSWHAESATKTSGDARQTRVLGSCRSSGPPSLPLCLLEDSVS